MISIIICSRKADISQELKDNIAATIGCEYELCVIDNSRNEYNIFTAYNDGVGRAKGDILCFMHEDVSFHTNAWGDKVSSYIAEHKDIGALGVMGGHYLPKRPCYWLEPRKESANYIQGGVCEGQYHARRILHQQYKNTRTFVAALDGVFIAMPAQLFKENKVRWDDQTFSGYHFYDADICMQVHRAGYNVEVVWDVLLEHRNKSVFDSAFIDARQLWYNKWKDSLPIIEGIMMDNENIEVCERIMDVTDDSYQYCLLLQSRAYRLGKAILHPNIANLKALFIKNK